MSLAFVTVQPYRIIPIALPPPLHTMYELRASACRLREDQVTPFLSGGSVRGCFWWAIRGQRDVRVFVVGARPQQTPVPAASGGQSMGCSHVGVYEATTVHYWSSSRGDSLHLTAPMPSCGALLYLHRAPARTMALCPTRFPTTLLARTAHMVVVCLIGHKGDCDEVRPTGTPARKSHMKHQPQSQAAAQRTGTTRALQVHLHATGIHTCRSTLPGADAAV